MNGATSPNDIRIILSTVELLNLSPIKAGQFHPNADGPIISRGHPYGALSIQLAGLFGFSEYVLDGSICFL